jgi:hypothetical protein
MPSLKRLESKYEDLEEEYDEVRKKLNWFKKERITKTDSEAKYELEQRIEEYGAKLKEIESELDDLEEQISQPKRTENTDLEQSQTFDFLYKSLLKLGYWEQHNLFEEIIRNYSHGVFLIQGRSKDDGQRWLLNRLASIMPDILKGKIIPIDLNRTSSRTDILAIWDEFARRVGLPENSNPSEIAEKICDQWKTQDVLVVFNNVDETIEENLGDLLDIFWTSLTHIISEDRYQHSNFKLLIFLLDYQGVVTQWNVGIIENYDSNWHPKDPLSLPRISPFSDRDLREWLNYQSDFLPLAIAANKTETVEALMEKQGVPMSTIIKICDLCDCNWFEQEGKWLRL